MNAYSDHGRHERIVLLCMDEHAVQAVIVQDAVVDAFCGSALVVYFLIRIRAAWDFGIKSDIPFGPGLDVYKRQIYLSMIISMMRTG